MTVTVTISGANDAPTVATAISDATTAEDSAYSLDISANFADVDDSLTFTATGMPSTITMSTAGVLTGTPVNANVGTHTIVVTATDGTASITDTFVLTVANVNDIPTVSSPQADVSTAEDTAYSLDISGNFASGDASDTLTYTATGMPSTMTMSTAGVLSGTPVNADVGTSTISSNSY